MTLVFAFAYALTPAAAPVTVQSTSTWSIPLSLFAVPLLLLPATIGSQGTKRELENFTVIDFLKNVQRFHGFDTLLIAANRNATVAAQFLQVPIDTNSAYTQRQFVREIVHALPVDVLLLSELGGGSLYLRKHMSASLLSVVHIDNALMQHNELLRRFATVLLHLRQTRVLFLLNEPHANTTLLQQLFQHCRQERMINVAALFLDFQETGNYYSYTQFPEFQLERHKIYRNPIENQDVYPYRLNNLKGYKLRYVIGGADPRVIIYRQPNGSIIVNGFVGHFMQTFGMRYNCQLTLAIPLKIDETYPPNTLLEFVRNGTVELSASLTFPGIPILGYTYPYEVINWCFLLPVEPDIPYYEFFVAVFELKAFFIMLGLMVLISVVLSWALYQHGNQPDLLDVIFHDNCLRGVLGQSFSEILHPPIVVRFIYLQICVLGILLTTSYNSYFSTYVTTPPKEPRINSFDDILHSGKKVFMWTPEYGELIERIAEFRKYAPMFYPESDYQRFLKMRDSFSTKYIYLVPTAKRVIINEQQNIFTTPIFHQSEELCAYHNIPMVFPINENSVFMDIVYMLILETAQSGLTDHWRKMGLNELIAAGKLHLVDLSKKAEYQNMRIEDLKYIWLAMGFAYMLITVIFFCEFCWGHRTYLFWYCKKFYKIKLCRKLN